MFTGKFFALSVMVALMIAFPALTGGAEYPDHPIEMILNYPPGASLDISTRIIHPPLQKILGVPIMMSTKAGGGGALGADFLANSKPDGYRIGSLTFLALTTTPQFNKAVPYKMTDFIPVCTHSMDPLGIVSRKDAPWKTFEELIDYAKKNPGKLSYGNPGMGGTGFIMMELVKIAYGLDIAPVNFQGAGPLKTAILGGHVNVVMGGFSAFKPLVKEGSLIGLAVTSTKRLPDFPQIPTMIEKGFPEASLNISNGIVVPKGTPKPILDKLSAAMATVMKDPAVSGLLEKSGVMPEYRDSPATLKLWDEEWKAVEKVVKKLGVQ